MNYNNHKHEKKTTNKQTKHNFKYLQNYNIGMILLIASKHS